MLIAGSSLDQTFLPRTRLHTMIARHAHHFRYDRQSAKGGSNLIKRQPEFRSPRDSRRLHMADVSANLGAGRQINPAARFEWFERLYFEFFVFLWAPGTQFIFEPHQKPRPRSNGKRFYRQSVAFTVGRLPLAWGLVVPVHRLAPGQRQRLPAEA